MMVNSTQFTHFIFSAYTDIGLFKYLFFLIALCLYVLMLVSNVLLLVVICVNRSLHEPMYLFLCPLFVNELYGSTVLFPFLLFQILTDVHTISVSLCFLQVFCFISYGLLEILTLTVMSYDRYVAICHPLQYHTCMTRKKIAILIAIPWFYGFLFVVAIILLNSSLELCGNVIDKVRCGNYSVTRLACSDITTQNIYGFIFTFINLIIPLVLILYTYMKILKVCFSGSKQTRNKAVSTCTPHMASLINFILGACFDIIQSRFNMKHVPNVLRIFLSLYFLICQPLFNPLVYGLSILRIRTLCKRFLCCKM